MFTEFRVIITGQYRSYCLLRSLEVAGDRNIYHIVSQVISQLQTEKNAMPVKNMVMWEGAWEWCPQNGDIGIEITDNRSPIGKGLGEEGECPGLREWSLKVLRREAESQFPGIARRSVSLGEPCKRTQSQRLGFECWLHYVSLAKLFKLSKPQIPHLWINSSTSTMTVVNNTVLNTQKLQSE